MIYYIDKQRWYEIEDALDWDGVSFNIHWADDQDQVGLEFETDQDLAWFVLRYAS